MIGRYLPYLPTYLRFWLKMKISPKILVIALELMSYYLDPDPYWKTWIRILCRIEEKSWIRISRKRIRIRNTDYILGCYVRT